MADFKICAGTMKQLRERKGDWIFVDIGFSNKSKTCGFLHVNRCGETIRQGAMTFGCLRKSIIKLVKDSGPPLHLVLEAPLSTAFDDLGNPLGRKLEKRGSETRYWYVGLGCAVLVACLYLLKAIKDAKRARDVHLFEGFVSFKKGAGRSDHLRDVRALKDAVWSDSTSFYDTCYMDRSANISATLALLGFDDMLPPPIIMVE